jgi:restriction system protein
MHVAKQCLYNSAFMAQPRTLFSILLEQPWWIAALAGLALFGIAQMAFPPVAPFVALPFMLIALYVGYRQLRTVSPAQVEARLNALRALSWEQFGQVITQAYQRQGYSVEAANQPAYDYTLSQNGRITLLQCRRWKVNQLGIGPLQDLAKAVAGAAAHNGICITAGSLSPQARAFAAGKPLSLVTGRELAMLVGKTKF